MSSAVIGAEGHVSICNVWHGRLLGAHDRNLSLQRHRIHAASTITIDWTAPAQQALLFLTDAPMCRVRRARFHSGLRSVQARR